MRFRPNGRRLIARRIRPIGAAEEMAVFRQIERAIEAEHDFIGESQRQNRRSFGFLRQGGRERQRLRREKIGRQRDDRFAGGDHALVRLEPQSGAAVIEPTDAAGECDGQFLCERGDPRAIAFENAPIDVGVGVTRRVMAREPIRFDAADIGRHRRDQRIEAIAGFEKGGSRLIGLFQRLRVDPLVETLAIALRNCACSFLLNPRSRLWRPQAGSVRSMVKPMSLSKEVRGLTSAE